MALLDQEISYKLEADALKDLSIGWPLVPHCDRAQLPKVEVMACSPPSSGEAAYIRE